MSASTEKTRVGFLGAGRMASALTKGLVTSGFTTAESIIASDPLDATRQFFATQSGARATASNVEVVRSSDVVFVAVKPQNVSEVLAEIRSEIKPRHLVISIAAGVPLNTLIGFLGTSARLVRAMPNTPCLVGAGAAAYALGGGASAADGELVSPSAFDCRHCD